jgi:hypothetical protein
MNRSRLLASVLVVVLAVVSIGTATAWFSDSAILQFEITAAPDFDPDGHDKVWVCKLIGPPEDPWVKPGKNPIHVSIESTDAEEAFTDSHPSYIVEHGDVECEARPADGPSLAPVIPDTETPDVVDEPDADRTALSTTTTTTVITTTTPSEPSDQTPTTTTSTPPPETSTTTLPPETTTTTQPTTTSEAGD